MPLPSTTLDDYVVLEVIGEGSFGRVYRGRRRFTAEIVALKMLPRTGRTAKEVALLQREIEIMQSLSHPNIITLLDSFETPNDVVVVTDYAEGEIFQVLEDDKFFPPRLVQSVAVQLVAALKYLHANRILHRDLKPQNILIGKEGRILLCDFGFARLMSNNTQVLTSVKGTPLYMAPEVVMEKPYDHTSDLWALGCILFELAVGTPPFFTNSIFELVNLIIKTEIKWPAEHDMEPQMRSFLSGLLIKDRHQRLTWPHVDAHPYVAEGVRTIESRIHESQFGTHAQSPSTAHEDETILSTRPPVVSADLDHHDLSASLSSTRSSRTLSEPNTSRCSPADRDAAVINWSEHERRARQSVTACARFLANSSLVSDLCSQLQHVHKPIFTPPPLSSSSLPSTDHACVSLVALIVEQTDSAGFDQHDAQRTRLLSALVDATLAQPSVHALEALRTCLCHRHRPLALETIARLVSLAAALLPDKCPTPAIAVALLRCSAALFHSIRDTPTATQCATDVVASGLLHAIVHSLATPQLSSPACTALLALIRDDHHDSRPSYLSPLLLHSCAEQLLGAPHALTTSVMSTLKGDSTFTTGDTSVDLPLAHLLRLSALSDSSSSATTVPVSRAALSILHRCVVASDALATTLAASHSLSRLLCAPLVVNDDVDDNSTTSRAHQLDPQCVTLALQTLSVILRRIASAPSHSYDTELTSVVAECLLADPSPLESLSDAFPTARPAIVSLVASAVSVDNHDCDNVNVGDAHARSLVAPGARDFACSLARRVVYELRTGTGDTSSRASFLRNAFLESVGRWCGNHLHTGVLDDFAVLLPELSIVLLPLIEPQLREPTTGEDALVSPTGWIALLRALSVHMHGPQPLSLPASLAAPLSLLLSPSSIALITDRPTLLGTAGPHAVHPLVRSLIALLHHAIHPMSTVHPTSAGSSMPRQHTTSTTPSSTSRRTDPPITVPPPPSSSSSSSSNPASSFLRALTHTLLVDHLVTECHRQCSRVRVLGPTDVDDASDDLEPMLSLLVSLTSAPYAHFIDRTATVLREFSTTDWLASHLLSTDNCSSVVIVHTLTVLTHLVRTNDDHYALLGDDCLAVAAPLATLLRVPHSAMVRARACHLVGNLCRHSDMLYLQLKRHAVLPALVACLSDDDPGVRKFAAFAVGNALFHSELLFDTFTDAIRPLVRLLSDSSTDRTAANAAGALGNFARRTGAMYGPLRDANVAGHLVQLACDAAAPINARRVAIFSLGNYARFRELRATMPANTQTQLSDALLDHSPPDPTMRQYLERFNRKLDL